VGDWLSRYGYADFSNASYSKFFLLSFQFFVTFMNCQFSIFLIKFMFEIF